MSEQLGVRVIEKGGHYHTKTVMKQMAIHIDNPRELNGWIESGGWFVKFIASENIVVTGSIHQKGGAGFMVILEKEITVKI